MRKGWRERTWQVYQKNMQEWDSKKDGKRSEQVKDQDHQQ